MLPNPSGLNAHSQLDDLARWYRAAAEAAGIPITVLMYRDGHNPQNGDRTAGGPARQRRSRPVASAGHAGRRAGQLPQPGVDPGQGRPRVLASIIFAETGLLIGFFLPGDSLLFVGGFLASDAGGHRLPILRSWHWWRSPPP